MSGWFLDHMTLKYAMMYESQVWESFEIYGQVWDER